MRSNKPHVLLRFLVEAAEGAFWTSLLAGAVTAVLSYLLLWMLVSMPSEGGDEEWALVVLVVFPLLAAASAVMCWLITSFRRPPRASPWLIAAAVAIGASVLLAVGALVSDWSAAAALSLLCWTVSSALAVPAASAVSVYLWLSRRSARGVPVEPCSRGVALCAGACCGRWKQAAVAHTRRLISVSTVTRQSGKQGAEPFAASVVCC